ncbi:MAG: CRISPR-associated endonuclease Cas3'' [Magnetococcales bacterium]|nr:CRISPR-associated endonuclease Cas3'' [Magnetococcales bacterium]
MILYAHLHQHTKEKEPLCADAAGHLERTAARAARFALEMIPAGAPPGLASLAEDAGRLLGWWHDLGKGSRAFQSYLLAGLDDAHALERRGRVDHATAGAQHAVQTIPGVGLLFAFAIAGHHAGLPDWSGTGEAVLKQRLRKAIEPWQEFIPPGLLTAPGFPRPLPLPRDAFACAFFTRMLFSCLKDADFLATESFMNPERAVSREQAVPSMAELADHLQGYLAAKFPHAVGTVGRYRAEVMRACLQAAIEAPGNFALNVPTGGGKTFSGLAFGLRHAARHGLRRIICAIPFTSIIEQNARVYREAFAPLGEEIVLEHHASLASEETRLATENWDAPIVVTTNVRFFETLFANRPGECRKLHRIARSVIILDEAQALPVSLLAPCLAALRELVRHYGCTVVLATATQPALQWRESFKIGLQEIRQIVPEAAGLHAALRRVRIEDRGSLSLEETAALLAGQERVLAIVNTRRHARELYQSLAARVPGETCFHLSALMCPAHRLSLLDHIKQRLTQTSQPCRVVATQLVEAGVDLDFPVVCRAMAGLDALAQAAGRCNREGRLPDLGVTWLFIPAEAHFHPAGDLGQAAQCAQEVLALPEGRADCLSPAAIERYFRLHYWQKGGETGSGWDRPSIMDCFRFGDRQEPFLFQFRTATEGFRLIENRERPVIIPWDDRARQEIGRLRALHHPEPALLARATRVLQRYVVSVPVWQHDRLARALAIECLHERFWVLLDLARDYASATGLRVAREEGCDPADLIV